MNEKTKRFLKAHSDRAPGLTQKAAHLSAAAGRTARAFVRGEPVRVSAEERDRRLAICRSCEFWRERGNIGMGLCRHPGCGCTRFKQGLATETCPLGKW